ncbi:hypothetical protein [Candidatus Frankia nodulisporulans]|uniref:hypothetical protein n=1 Tax=Candidatus Frankia nodulisporulans TaxID=2060052 RepID=UPI001CDB9921|nr:hypothetical protein [Candidatus Frankia nodulisporulans]
MPVGRRRRLGRSAARRSVARRPGGPPGSGAGLVGLVVRLPGASPALLRLTPDEAGRLAGLLAETNGGDAAAGAVDLVPDGSGGASGSRYVVVAPEGAPVAELWPALAALPPAARLVDFASDAEVVLVFGLDDPRWPIPPREAGSGRDARQAPSR